MSTGLIVGIVVVVIIVVLIGWGVSAYNNLVTLKNRVKNGWAQIDVQLKQRADLIPNLVNTVKGYASHESEVFTQVTAARAGVVAAASNPSTTTAQRAAAENQLSRALFNLQATAEAYPQLQANQNFMDLQNQLKELENKIAYARQFYNDVVLKLNTAIETVPTNIIAGLFHFEQAQYFEAMMPPVRCHRSSSDPLQARPVSRRPGPYCLKRGKICGCDSFAPESSALLPRWCWQLSPWR